MRASHTNFLTPSARTGRHKTTLQVLWGKYTSTPALPGQRYYSYERFRQLVAQHVDATGVTARIVHAPAHTMQVDWAGTKMRLFDPTGDVHGCYWILTRALLDSHHGVTKSVV